jgi:hypothetical protein
MLAIELGSHHVTGFGGPEDEDIHARVLQGKTEDSREMVTIDIDSPSFRDGRKKHMKIISYPETNNRFPHCLFIMTRLRGDCKFLFRCIDDLPRVSQYQSPRAGLMLPEPHQCWIFGQNLL